MRATVLVTAVLATMAPASASAAEERLTPEGPSTIRAMWLGPSTAEGRPPEIITRWSVTVGAGGRAGRVRLRVLASGSRATVRGNGAWEWLPAEPGTYEFPAPHVPFDYRDNMLALDQEVGGHALITFHPDDPGKDTFSDVGELQNLDVFRPPLADDARDVERTERRQGEELRIWGKTERDLDGDGLGDETEDVGDLTALSARVSDWRDGYAIVTARVRNSGTTVRNMPAIAFPQPISDAHCVGCPVPPLAPGEETELALAVNVSGEGVRGPVPTQVEVASEGPDTNPADNVVALTPNLTVKAVTPPRNRGAPGVTVAVTTDLPATVRVAARIAGVRLKRTVEFAAAGTRTIRLTPKSRADRQRLKRALRRRGRLTAVVTADAAGGASARRRVVMRR
ncbi:MAG TPA: hypothetical protein VF549_11400 [Solirubrobacteraceae bacterium]